jgi:hypothetical protein
VAGCLTGGRDAWLGELSREVDAVTRCERLKGCARRCRSLMALGRPYAHGSGCGGGDRRARAAAARTRSRLGLRFSTVTNDEVNQSNFHDYEPLRISDMPKVEVLLAVRNMGGGSEAAWRGLLDALISRGLRAPDFVISTVRRGWRKRSGWCGPTRWCSAAPCISTATS